jgi:endonuclease/exonuclease/phosphatase family metal-dependent hydrolase
MKRLGIIAGLYLLSVLSVSASSLRVATFNTSLNRRSAGELADDLSAPGDEQASKIAAILQRNRPDIVLLNEFDFDADGTALAGFAEHYLAIGQRGEMPIEYPFQHATGVNTGVLSGVDLDSDGAISLGNDAFGWGRFPGQYGMAVLSRYPIDASAVRTFTSFLWKDMPGALLPVDPITGVPYYSDEALAVFRLSSKSHWDVPVEVDGQVIHILASHPTPPVFDGPENRNGRRNHDEIRFWADYLSPGRATYLRDDSGMEGGLCPEADFVIVGDLNADPFDGEWVAHAVRMLLEHPRVAGDFTPFSDGAVEAANRQRRANDSHQGDPAFDTADFSDSGPGNLRADYVLPSRSVEILDGGVFWPPVGDPTSKWTDASDHRLVWIDLEFSTPVVEVETETETEGAESDS